jgi:hypothetical protein
MGGTANEFLITEPLAFARVGNRAPQSIAILFELILVLEHSLRPNSNFMSVALDCAEQSTS